MKKLFQMLSVAVLLVAATSCDSITNAVSGTKMDTVEATQKVVDGLKKNVDFNEWKIYEVYWMEGEKLENDLVLLCVSMINKSNDCFSQTFHVGGQMAGHAGDLSKAIGIGVDKLTFDGVKGITPEMINPETIQKQYEAGKTMVPKEYEFKSIGRYMMKEVIPSGNKFLDKDKKIGEIESSFDINVIEPGKEYVESAGKKSLQYYEISFNVMPDGSVEIDD